MDAAAATKPRADRIDWSQLWYPGPQRIFSDAELARAATDAPSRTLLAAVLINVAVMAAVAMMVAPPQITAQLMALMVIGAAAAWPMALRLWYRPTRRALTMLSVSYLAGSAAAAAALRAMAADSTERTWALSAPWVIALLVTVLLWFLTVFRAEQLDLRLRELDERELARERACQLAAAQMQPHFLFNALASLQHWVQTGDRRAAPMLAALSGFLRATLPLFERPRLRLGEEIEAVRQYLEVMRLRFGDRLSYVIDASPQALAVELPPGLVLALVENAIEHGVSPSVEGGRIELKAALTGKRLKVEIHDNGSGPAPGTPDGVGLANSRARLALAYGSNAVLRVAASPPRGCVALIDISIEGPG